MKGNPQAIEKRVCVCYEQGAMVEHCHRHSMSETDAKQLVEELNRKRGYARYWTLHYCPDGNESIFHYRNSI